MTIKTEMPLPEEMAEARQIPGGWVYRIGGRFRQGEDIPPEAIIGAWKVNDDGIIVGGFVRNNRYDPMKWPAST